MRIGQFDVDRNVLIIAELGNNHEGNYDVAAEMIERAAAAGVDAVKVQVFNVEQYVSMRDVDRYNRLKSFQLTPYDFERLSALAREHGLLFIATPFDLDSVETIRPISSAIKIASGDNTFYPLIEAVAAAGKPCMVSSGLATLDQMQKTKSVIERVWERDGMHHGIAVLHCVTRYPVPTDRANLGQIERLRRAMDCTIGYSDHTEGINVSVMAVCAGARIVEKHFTLDKNYSDFRDHQLSSDPAEIAELVGRIRFAERMMGSGAEERQPEEAEIEPVVRRSIAAKRSLTCGDVVRLEDIMWVRPACGIPPGQEELVVGKQLTRNIDRGECILEDDVR